MKKSCFHERSRPSYRTLSLGLLVAACCGAVQVRAQPVQGDVGSIGFQAAVPTRYVIRYGQWYPILVNLNAQGTQSYEVELRCEGSDLDGDHITYTEPHVVVTPAAGIKRVWCYAVTLREQAGPPPTIDVIGDDGALISKINVPLCEAIGNDTQLILDISTNRVTTLERIKSDPKFYVGLAWGNRAYYRSICIAALPARDLPDRWWGLEAVDVIVWDEPNPDSLSIAQLEALVRWVRNGGQLVLGVGPAGALIQNSALAEIMPLKFTQAAVEVSRLPTFQARYTITDSSLESPISVALGAPVSDALVTFKERLPDNNVFNLIGLHCVGAGRVIAVAARLNDLGLLRPRTEYLHELLDLNRNQPEFKANELSENTMFRGLLRLYDPLIGQIEFRRLAGARVLAAFAFVAAYILMATFGAWSWLRRHSLTHLSWITFAGFAVVAGALSLGAVGLTRGVTGVVHSYSFVELDSDSSQARGTAYFGYKSNRRQRIEIALPGQESYLRGLASAADRPKVYTTPERYTALAGSATLADTPMRATLKQFEGFWSGELGGRIHGDLTTQRSTGKITLNSWLQNELELDFIGGYLLYIDPRLSGRDGGVPDRISGMDTRSDRAKYYGSEKVPAAVNILAVQLPPLRAGERITRLGVDEYAEYESKHYTWASRANPDPELEPMLPTLRFRQFNDWVGSLDIAGGDWLRPDAAALLASTRNMYLHNGSINDFTNVGVPLDIEGLVDQDVTHWLIRGQAILLLLSDQPGPATLYLDGEPKAAKEGRAIYRVRIPLKYSGRPPRGTNE